MRLTYDGEGKFFLHQQIGKCEMPDGRKCRLLQTNAGIHMQVDSKTKAGKWETFSLSYMELSKVIVDEITKMSQNHKKVKK